MILGKNKKAYFDYQILQTFEAGIVLDGWEVKSIKNRQFSLKESHVDFVGSEMFMYNMHVSPWKGIEVREVREARPRKLLLNRREIDSLIGSKQQKGLTIVPINIHLSRGRIKLEIALAKGKKKGDKRQAIKEREDKKAINRDLKSMGY